MASILQVHPSDDAIVALHDLDAGAALSLNGNTWTLREKIPAKQKFAAHDFAVGDVVTMYGVTVGKASVVTSGSVVVNNVPPYTMVQGNPAKVIKHFPQPEGSRE